jgi:hypothetical protein
MRVLKYFLIGMAALCLAGFLYLRRMGIDPKGTTISQSITLGFVRKNVFRIADAEHEQVISFSQCFTLDQLIDMGKLNSDVDQRGGYSFTISCNGDGSGFTVTATHPPAPPDSPLPWPEVVVDQTMALTESY